MGHTVRFQETLRRLAIIDEGVVQDQAGPWVMDPKTATLVQIGALVAIGSPAVCLEWGTSQALAAGATEGEITDVLPAVAPAAGSAGSSPPRSAWWTGSGMTSRRRWTQMIADGSPAAPTATGPPTVLSNACQNFRGPEGL